MPRTVRVAAVQVASENGKIADNLARALPFVNQAAEQGARLVVLPEFQPTGYLLHTDIWNAAERNDGTTVQWLRSHSQRLGVYLGTSYLEADGEDFYNTFLLTSPDGTDAGTVRKEQPATFENYFTLGDPNPHVIETELGRLGVGICFENHMVRFLERMQEAEVDLMLQPHSAPTPGGAFISKRASRGHDRNVANISTHYAKHLGVPVVMTNKCGPWVSSIPRVPFMRQRSRFPGLSAIVEAGGEVRARLGSEEGVIVEDVVLDPSRRVRNAPPRHGRWALPVPASAAAFKLVERAGAGWYRRSKQRPERARLISG